MVAADIHDIRELTRTGAIPIQAPPAQDSPAGTDRAPRPPRSTDREPRR